ncbi:MAG TPA: hypothetical protein VLD58_03750 [Gemmatimonadales bacterium]|nr:hypothetical protein [Gemmatimonadales bacterium]
MTARRWSETSHPRADPFFQAVRCRLAAERAPDTLRIRIGMMLALEQLAGGAGEPGHEGPR